MKNIKTERDDPSWAAQEGQLLIPISNLDLISDMRSTGTSMDIFVRGVGVGLKYTEKFSIKKLGIARKTCDLEAETGEDPKKRDIERVVESYFMYLKLLGDEGDGEAARGPGRPGLVLDEIERLPRGKGKLPVYDPSRGRLHPLELLSNDYVIFSDTNIQVYLHKKFYLSKG